MQTDVADGHAFAQLLGDRLVLRVFDPPTVDFLPAFTCSKCTYETSSGNKRCSMCDAPNPKAVLAAPKSSSAWHCETCTFENASNRKTCEMCNTAAPAAKPPKPTYRALDTSKHLAGKYVGLYFSSYSNPPCRET